MKLFVFVFFAFCLFISGCVKNDDSEPIKSYGDIIVYFNYNNLDQPHILKLNDTNKTSFIANYDGFDICEDGNYIGNKIRVQVGYSYHITAENSLIKWDLPGIEISKAGECYGVELSNDNAQNPQKSSIVFSSETGFRNVYLKIDGNSVGLLTEPTSFNNQFSTITLPITIGSHSYYCESDNGHLWSGSIQAMNGKTTKIDCGKFNAQPVPPNHCNIVFHTSNFSNVSIILDGNYIGRMFYGYPPGTSDLCIKRSVVSIFMPIGIYNYTASDLNGHSWSGSVNANINGGCVLVDIQ